MHGQFLKLLWNNYKEEFYSLMIKQKTIRFNDEKITSICRIMQEEGEKLAEKEKAK